MSISIARAESRRFMRPGYSLNVYFSAVKFIVGIFSIYLAILAVCPCTEGCCLDRECEGEINMAVNPIPEEPSLCSPFCMEDCCVIHIGCPVQPLIVPPDIKYCVIDVPAFDRFQHSLLSHTIWQPPRIC